MPLLLYTRGPTTPRYRPTAVALCRDRKLRSHTHTPSFYAKGAGKEDIVLSFPCIAARCVDETAAAVLLRHNTQPVFARTQASLPTPVQKANLHVPLPIVVQRVQEAQGEDEAAAEDQARHAAPGAGPQAQAAAGRVQAGQAQGPPGEKPGADPQAQAAARRLQEGQAQAEEALQAQEDDEGRGEPSAIFRCTGPSAINSASNGQSNLCCACSSSASLLFQHSPTYLSDMPENKKVPTVELPRYFVVCACTALQMKLPDPSLSSALFLRPSLPPRTPPSGALEAAGYDAPRGTQRASSRSRSRRWPRGWRVLELGVLQRQLGVRLVRHVRSIGPVLFG